MSELDKQFELDYFEDSAKDTDYLESEVDLFEDEAKTVKDNLFYHLFSSIKLNIESIDKIKTKSNTQFSGIKENWEEINIYDARVTSINENIVELDCLIDRENQIFEVRQFDRTLFGNIRDLKLGSYIIIRIFKKPGKISFTINNGEKLVDKTNFEEHPEFSDLDDIKTEPVDLNEI